MILIKNYLKISALITLSIFSIFFIIFVFSPYVHLHTIIALHSFQSRLNLNSIDKVYIINLDNYPQRYQNTVQALETLNLPASHIRFSAINGRKIQLTQNNTSILLGDVFPDKMTSLKGIFQIEYNGALHDSFVDLTPGSESYQKLEIRHPRGPRFPGATGCYCSHREVWNDILQKGYKKVLILEDDVTFSPRASTILNLALKNILEPCDILFLGIFGQHDAFDESTTSLFFRKIIKNIFLLEAYIITDKAAKILLEHTQQYIKPIDQHISDLIEQKIITAYSTYPLISKQVGPSITASGLLD